jgi:hypothetical protein
LKSLTALGKKKKPDFEKCPNDFLYYHYPNINSDVKTVFSRFKSLTTYVGLIDYAKNEVDLYFGINVMVLLNMEFLMINIYRLDNSN